MESANVILDMKVKTVVRKHVLMVVVVKASVRILFVNVMKVGLDLIVQ